MRTIGEGLNETITFRLPYSERHHITSYLQTFCDEHAIPADVIVGKINALLIQYGIIDLPLDGIESSVAMFAMINSYPITIDELNGSSRSILMDSLNRPIYFLGGNFIDNWSLSNPHVDQMLFTEEALGRSETTHNLSGETESRSEDKLRPSMLPQHIRSQ